MKKIYILLLSIAAYPACMQAQTTVQIGTGTLTPTNTLYCPVYRFSATSTTTLANSDIVFTAAELATAGIPSGATITAVAFNKTNAFNFLIPCTYTMLMANSAAVPPLPGVMATQWPIILTTHTVVYNSSSFNIPATAGWFTINLTTPFVYTGGSLEIATDQIMTGGGTGATGNFAWEYTTGFATSIIGSATGNSNLATYKQRPNIRITYTTGPLSLVRNNIDLQAVNTDVQLNWGIEGDKKYTGFQVERSADGASFEHVGNVSAQPLSDARNYAYTDKDAVLFARKGVLYYRLRMLQENGAAAVSGTASIKVSNRGDMVTVHPNPFTDHISVTTSVQQKSDVAIEIYDHTGKRVHEQSAVADEGRQTIRVDKLGALPPGVYQVVVDANGSRQSFKTIK